jgi:phosphonate transport system substrate-binding protein
MLRFSSCMAPNMESMCRAIARVATERLGVETVFVGEIEWQARERRFVEGSIDVLWICGLPYVWNWPGECRAVEILAAPVMDAPRYEGRPVYYSDIVVRRDSGYTRFAELRGSRFVYNEPRSHSGYNVMRHHLAQSGFHSGFFAASYESGAHQQSIEWILEGRADVAAVDSTVLELECDRRGGLGEALSIVGTLGPSPMPPWIVRADLDPGVKRALRRLLVTLHEDADGVEMLAACGLRTFVEVDERHCEPIRRMAEEAAAVVL